MAQYVFDARKYPVGTLLSDLGWWENDAGGDFIVTAGGIAADYWRSTELVSSSFMTSKAMYTSYEVLLVRTDQATRYQYVANQILTKHGFRYYPTITQTGGGIPSSSYLNGYMDGGSYVQGTVGLGTTKDVDPGTTAEAIPMASRIKVQTDGTYAQRTWFVTFAFPIESAEDQEPTDWNIEGSTGLAVDTPFAVVTPSTTGAAGTESSAFTYISVGTDGDVAPYPDEDLVLTPPVVQVNDVTGTSATVSWG